MFVSGGWISPGSSPPLNKSDLNLIELMITIIKKN
jgi:hypothetical protein